jgi:hypothetical protein
MAAIDRIERRLDELAALQPAAGSPPPPEPAPIGPDIADLVY